MNPVIAVALGTIFLDEPMHWRMLVAAGIVGVGIGVVRANPQPASKSQT